MKYAEKVAGKLNNLLEKNYDTEKGYRFAAENVSNPRLKAFFNDRAEERYDFSHELKSEIRNYGESPQEGSSFTGDLMRSWMNLKSHISLNKEEAILEETARGEKAAIDEYNDVLKEIDLPASTQNVLMKQRNAFSAALNKVNSLELNASEQ